MARQHLLSLLLIAAGLLLPAQVLAQQEPSRPEISVNDIEQSLDEEWLGLYFQGAKIGYVNSHLTKQGQGGLPFYREKFVLSMKLQSAGQKTEIKIDQTLDFEGKPPFRLIRGEYTNTNEKMVERITVNAGKAEKEYDALIVVGAVEQKKKVNDIDYTLADSLATELWLRGNPKKGDKLTSRSLELDHLNVDLVTTTMLGTKDALVSGVKVLFHEIKIVNHKTNIVSEAKHDDKGRIISGTVAGSFEVRREKAEDAKNTTFSADLFIAGMAKLDKGLGEDTSKLTSLVLELSGKELASLPDGPRQTLVAKGDDVFHLHLGKKHGKQVKAGEQEIKDACLETVAYPISDLKVKELAAKAVGDAKTDEDKAKNICQFVHKFIEGSMGTTAPKMHDLMIRKTGDCKSYALMFACLARAVGLPAREVSGFVYMGDDVKAFGGHAWNEVLLGGYWVPVDASMDQVDADPTHISLGTEKESAQNLLNTFGKLSFKLVSAERGP